MKTVNKVLFGSAAVLATAALAQFGGTAKEASAASISAADITIDYAKQQLKVNESRDNTGIKDLQIYAGIATVNAKTNVITEPKSWETYDDSSATIDLSGLKNNKDNYIQIKGNKNSDAITIKIPAVTEQLKAKFDAVNGVAKVTKKDKTDYTGDLQFRTQFSDWADLSNTARTFASYTQRGTTLYLRVPANPAESLTAATTATVKDKANQNVTCLVTKSFPGSEFKMSIAKTADAPKVKLDYANNVYTAVKGQEFRIHDDSTFGADYSKITVKSDKKPLATLMGERNNILEVRTAATASKPASKPTQIRYELEDIAPELKNGATTVENASKNEDKILNDVYGKLTVGATVTPKTKKGVTTYNIDFTNASTEYAYNVIVKDVTEAASTPAVGDKVTKKIAAHKVGKADTKLTLALKENQVVFVSRVGNASKKVWSTPYANLGTFVVPAADETPAE